MCLKIVPLIFYRTFVDNFCCNINIFNLLNHVKNVCIQEGSSNIHLIPQVITIMSYLHLILWIPSQRLLARFDNTLP